MRACLVVASAVTFPVPAAASQDPTGPGAADSRALFDRVRLAWERQSSLFQNVRYTATYVRPGSDWLVTQECLADNEGRFKVKEVQAPSVAGVRGFTSTNEWGFDGHVYWGYQKGAGSDPRRISSRGWIRPTQGLPSPDRWLFSRPPVKMFDSPDHVAMATPSEDEWDLWDDVYRVTVDPRLDFVITRFCESYNSISYTRHEYARTGQGFWYPRKVVVERDGRATTVSVLSLELNVRDADFGIGIPKGVQVTDHTVDSDFPDTYAYGMPRESIKQITGGYGRFIAGTAVDEQGRPVAGIPVRIIDYKAPLRSDQWDGLATGKGWIEAAKKSLNVQTEKEDLPQQARTDEQGRFALEVGHAGQYTLLFSPQDLAPTFAYDVAMPTKNLKVVFGAGGTVRGHVLRYTGQGREPVPNAQMCLDYEQGLLADSYNQSVNTDSEGGFQFDHLCTQWRGDPSKADLVPVGWNVSFRGLYRTITFAEGQSTSEVEFLIPPEPADMPSLVGRPLPGFGGVHMEMPPQDRIRDRAVLVCLFDMRDPISRSTLLAISRRAANLEEKGVQVFAMQMSGTDPHELRQWLEQIKVSFPVARVSSEDAVVRYDWAASSIPWLVLADRQHIVRLEGFDTASLDGKLDFLTNR